MSILRETWTKIGAGAAAAALVVAPAAYAEDAPDSGRIVLAEATLSPVSLCDDADYEADAWVVDQPDRLAVSVRLGGGTEIPAETIQDLITKDFAANGFPDIVFFWEQGLSDGGTSVAYHTDHYVSEPVGLGQARQEIPKFASRVRFDRQFSALDQ